MKNLGYLIAAYSVFWIGLLAYAGSLWRRTRAVRRVTGQIEEHLRGKGQQISAAPPT